jgi:hypothetical protein
MPPPPIGAAAVDPYMTPSIFFPEKTPPYFRFEPPCLLLVMPIFILGTTLFA